MVLEVTQFPQMTTTERLASSPSTDTIVYDSTLNEWYIWTGSVWEVIAGSTPTGDDNTVAFFNASGVLSDSTNFNFYVATLSIVVANPTASSVGQRAFIWGVTTAGSAAVAGSVVFGGTQAANTNDSTDGFVSGDGCIASGLSSFATGHNSQAGTDYAHAEGDGCLANGVGSHAEGILTTANDAGAHSEGESTTAGGNFSHAEGLASTTGGGASAAHAEGRSTAANGANSHAEGLSTIANGTNSHAEGTLTTASGNQAHAAGTGTDAEADNSTVIGTYNIASGTPGSPASTDNIFIVGNGVSGTPSNAFAVADNGSAFIQFQVLVADALQTVAATGTIATNTSYEQLTSTAAVTTSATTAIAAGINVGQTVVLDNQGTFIITIKNAAGTELPGANDFALNPKGTLTLIWTGSNWRSTAASQN